MEEKQWPTIPEIQTILTQFDFSEVSDSSIKTFVSDEGGNEYAV